MPAKSAALKKNLSLLNVYALATGATLSAGFFLLPGLAAEKAGPALVLAYLLAAIPLVPAMLSKTELMTAMPRAGGMYYFLDRSLGPAVGTIGGIGVWLVLLLKVAFALVGMGAYLTLFFPHLPVEPVAVVLAIVIGLLNLYGAKLTGIFQTLLLGGLLSILALFIGAGLPAAEPAHFRGFFEAGPQSIFATAGLVYVSYAGLTKVAGVAEEVKNPERNLTWGILLALGTALVVYGLGTAVIVGVVPMAQLQGDLTSVATAGAQIFGPWGATLLTVAALLAFIAVTNAGILSTSRYPLAMSRDRIMPATFKKLNAQGMPGRSILLTVGVLVGVIVFLDPMSIAKLASVFQLLVFSFVCLAVIVMRESHIESYDPGFHSPLYPWTQILGIVAPIALIASMGWLSVVFSIGLVAAASLWYYFYAREKTPREGAIYHLFERLGRSRHEELDYELREIIKEKGLREGDPFGEVVARASVLDLDGRPDFEQVVRRGSDHLAEILNASPEELAETFMRETQLGITPVSHGVALLHLRPQGLRQPHMLLVRVAGGVEVEVGRVMVRRSDAPTDSPAVTQEGASLGKEVPIPTVHALFFLLSPEEDPQQHLRLMARMAGLVESDDFLTDWLEAPGEQVLKETLLRDDRFLSLHLHPEPPTAGLINRPIREIDLPEGLLVALVKRNGTTLFPRGGTVLEEGDRLTVIGPPADLRRFRKQYAG